MDYPLSLASSLDLKDGKFTDGVPGLYPASVNPSQSFNDVIDEILAVQDEGGVVRDEFNRTQLKTAIKNMIEARVGDYSIDTGAANAYVIAMNPPITVYPNGMPFRFRATHANTISATTLNAGGGAVALVRDDGTALQPGDITIGMLVSGYYDKPANQAIISSLVASQTLTQAAADARYLLKTNPFPAGLPLMWPTQNIPSWALVRDGSAIPRVSYATLFAVLCPTRSGVTVAGSNALTGLSSTADLYVGMPIEAVGIPAGVTVATITSLTAVTMSANATASATVPVTLFYYGYGAGGSATTFGLPDDRGLFERGLDTGARGYEKTTLNGTTTNAANTVTGLSTTKGLFIGMSATGAGLAVGATIASISSATSVTLSGVSTQSATGPIVFSGGQIANERGDTFQGHWHESYVDTAHAYTPGGTIADYLATFPQGAAPGSIRNPIVDALSGTPNNGTPRTGAETRGRFRDYTPIMTF